MQPDDPTDRDVTADDPAIPHWHVPGSEGLTLVDGDGATVTDGDGTTYLDFVSQLYCANAGYSNDAITEGMYEQLHSLPYAAPKHGTDSRSELARQLVEVGPDDHTDVLFSVSGSEAVELAVHVAREHQDAPKVLSRYRAYHGSTYGAGSLTTDPLTRNTLEQYASTSGAVRFLPPLTHRSPFNADSPEELAQLATDHLEFVIRNEGPDSIAAIITEPVAGTSGAYTAPPGYFERVREICDTYDCLLVVDEVLTGFGRCGEWFGYQTENVEPDIVTFAKGVTGGYAPLAGVLLREDIAESIRTNGFDIGQTWGGHPVSCAAGVAAMEEYRSGLLENVRELAPTLERRLTELAETHPVVGDVRGRGFLWAVEFDTPGTDEPVFDHRVEDGVDPIFDVLGTAAADHGVLFGPGRPTFNLMVAPPFCISEKDIHTAVDALDRTISSVFG
ncbi:aminotransferase class III-fold pyridoxal phosphate-dependent enzyme [Halostella sp. PRR32]|uniref:aminotransferase family protein n=1 Tax=Halostella sp. PRR32 TaxID=3098147 RepID=UPI002B1D8383|nr:aminotransferase class III-fold pyridoxal phosphate-dependent enzyme [Halostella sp. PRR32]